MFYPRSYSRILTAAAMLAVLLPLAAQAQADDDDDRPVATQSLPNTGQTLTPLAPRLARFEDPQPQSSR